eukprot:1007513-Rhodomonas_salina.2
MGGHVSVGCGVGSGLCWVRICMGRGQETCVWGGLQISRQLSRCGGGIVSAEALHARKDMLETGRGLVPPAARDRGGPLVASPVPAQREAHARRQAAAGQPVLPAPRRQPSAAQLVDADKLHARRHLLPSA